MRLHAPLLYRYKVAASRRVPRVRLNRYGWRAIGAYAVVGRFAYCVKWAGLR
jgi:hypothetical protein